MIKARKPTARNRDEARDVRLLDAAEALLLEEGYAAVTSRRVAERAGVNPALLYYYFESMDGLFVALFRRGAQSPRSIASQNRAAISLSAGGLCSAMKPRTAGSAR